MLRSLLLILSLLFSLPGFSATLLVLGDSISAGYGVDRGKGWVELMQQQLRNEHHVVNASISGDTTGGGLSRLDTLIEEHAPDFVLIELGGNDGLRGYPIHRIKENLRAMINLIRLADSQPILFSMRIPPNYGKRYSEQFSNAYSDIAEEENVPLLPFLFEDIAANPDLMLDDGIHPSEQAQPLIAERTLKLLTPLLNGDEY
ncbi:arylesterase [Porticoccus litoralis]|jgi:acyl-CoA thioesterase-1|uniref:Arylesterase n=1 Tax=Porticoccus litoralis TaxID=434086 RepID=A0AAW8B2I4_9GAMM|nr:arylesterase [Porticoccus litoralis]MDP1520439.1 arylesterase [Porticoccus litoralis]